MAETAVLAVGAGVFTTSHSVTPEKKFEIFYANFCFGAL